MGTGPITFTLDLEDHRPSDAAEDRAPMLTREVLGFLDARDVRGTFFVVGETAVAHPDLVTEVAARGHEVALHGWSHTPLTELDAATLRADLRRGKALLEDLTSAPVHGFRAPIFSLVASSRWATDVMAEVGFTYSSSVLPARSPLYGDPTLPTSPFRWPNGLLELPCPVVRAAGLGLPYLGGVYLRAIPTSASHVARARFGRDSVQWIYCHPYDFDPDEPFWVVPEAGPLGSRLLWYNRRRTFAKVDALLRGRAGLPLAERLEEAAAIADRDPLPSSATATAEAP
ncbi:MAG: peptidoglycan-N-acetylglucosamine deacetylase [Actinomycetota bacterium]|nr:peptidoglycan-N-acetylglucosamine deacetylase [Actinomycetota bacterium]